MSLLAETTFTSADRPVAAANGPLAGKRIAMLAVDGFEQSELLQPRTALAEAGAEVVVVSPLPGPLRGWDHDRWGASVPVDLPLNAARAADFAALVLPGGVMNPDRLRMDAQAVAFVRGFVSCNQPIAAICHGPWTLIEADGVRGRHLTSWPSLRTDLVNAGAQWSDEAVVIDGLLVTSRKPDDLPRFIAAIIGVLSVR